MKYYTIDNEQLLIADNITALSKFYSSEVLELPEDYEPERYIVGDVEIPAETEEETVTEKRLIPNPEWDSIDLAHHKAAKITENDTARDTALNAGVTYRDVLFDSDTDQKINLLAIVSTMDDEQTIVWFGKDNQPLTCSKEDLINIGGLITALHSFCWNKNAEIKAAIAAANTVKKVEKIVIDYTIPTD